MAESCGNIQIITGGLNVSMRTPSKIRDVTGHFPYIVRFVTHGAMIKYSNIVKNLNKKPLSIPFANPLGFTGLSYIGFTSYHDLTNYPNINKGSMYQLINGLPVPLIDKMRTKGDEIMGDMFMKEGVVLTMFVYELSGR